MAIGDFGDFEGFLNFDISDISPLERAATLESTPQMAYFSSTPFQGGSSPMQQQYWGSQYGNVFNQYQGSLGTALRSGETAPSFLQFLESKPWTERYTSLSPSLRPGGGTRRFNPTARHMYR